ncbi:MAG: outer membrane beta-barrel protein [Nitrospirae bacterium]|nr:outer membrane beta-barrel protein [Nitrospirota bacterium]
MKVQVCPKNVLKRTALLALTAGLAVLIDTAPATAKEGPKMGGHVESTFNFNLMKKGGKNVNELRSYDNRANEFTLNAAHVMLAGDGVEGLTYTVELDAGSDAAVNKDPVLATTGYVDVQEAYMSYNLHDKVKWTMGKFVTFQGIEVIEGPANPTVSRGYLFGLAEAYTLTGTYFTIAPSDMFDIKLGYVNDWDSVIFKTSKRTLISRLGLNLGDPLTLGISPYFGGTVANMSIDVTGVTNVVSGMPINFQFNFGNSDAKSQGTDATWWGAGIQPVYSLSDTMALGLRYEVFSDKDGYRTTVADLLAHNFTITPAWKPAEGFAVRPEVRLDFASEKAFTDAEGNAKNTNLTASLGMSYTF